MTNALKRLILVGGDVTLLYVALFLALFVRSGLHITPEIWNRHVFPFTIVYFLWLLVLSSQNLYDAQTLGNRYLFFRGLVRTFAINGIIAVVFFYLIPFFSITPKTILFLDLFFFALLFVMWRSGYNLFMGSGRFRKNLLLIGEGKEIQEIADKLSGNPQLGYQPCAAIPRGTDIEDFSRHLETHAIHTVCFSQEEDAQNFKLYSLVSSGVEFTRTPQLYEEVTGKIPLGLIHDLWFLENLNRRHNQEYELFKRGFDILFSSILLLAVLPLWPLIMLAIKLEDGGAVFHKQVRVGKNGEALRVIKFRTMIEDAEKHGPLWSRENDPRITRVGRILRNALLDETPQLLLVLMGEMSLVGTRPERKEFVRELEVQIPRYHIRHMIKPGLTGWAQIHFGYGSSVDDAIQKLQYELYYIKNRSILLDLSILLKTVNIALERITTRKSSPFR